MKNDVVFVYAKRSPVCKAKKGGFRNTPINYVLEQTMRSMGDLIENIEEAVFGNVLIPNNGLFNARAACIQAGMPIAVPIMTVNRQCPSGLEAIKIIADRISTGQIKVGLAGGFESMSFYNMISYKEQNNEDDVFLKYNSSVSCNMNYEIAFKKSEIENLNISKNDENKKVEEQKNIISTISQLFLSVGETSEIIAKKYGIEREEVDLFAYNSHLKAFEAKDRGDTKEEIVSIINFEGEVISEDDGIVEPDIDRIKKCKPCFARNGITTAANASQISDGAAVVVMCTRKKAKELGLKVLGKYIDCLSVGCDPSIMGFGPVPAIDKLLSKNGLDIDMVDYFEINEAFGSQIVACKRKLNIKSKKLNTMGGSIGIGHPLGSTGARLLVSMLHYMECDKIGVISLCGASGIGTACLIMKE